MSIATEPLDGSPSDPTAKSRTARLFAEGLAFESGDLVRVTANPAGFEDRLVDRLLGAGFTIEQADQIAGIAVDEIDRGAVASDDTEALRQLVIKLDGTAIFRTAPGAALRRAILGHGGRSLEQDAAEVGVSKQGLHKHLCAIKRALFG